MEFIRQQIGGNLLELQLKLKLLSDASQQPLPLVAWRENVKLHLNKINVRRRGEREEKEEADRER